MTDRMVHMHRSAARRCQVAVITGLLLLATIACGQHTASHRVLPRHSAARSSAPGTDDPNGPYARESQLDPYAAAVENATGGRHADPVGYCSVAIAPNHNGLTVWWHGTPTATVTTILNGARRHGVRVTVRQSRHDKHQLGPIENRIVSRMIALHIQSVSIAPNCSTITVGLTHPTATDETPIRALAGPGAPLTFTVAAALKPDYSDLSPTSAKHH